MTLRVYNTLTKQKEEFKTIEPNKVSMYSCGVTVYDYCHLGHARSYTVWDVVRRYLEYIGYDVTYVQNFTDVDDKIIDRASIEGVTPHELTKRFIGAYFEDMHWLDINDAHEYPCVTDYIPQIISFIQGLEAKELTYITEDGIYFDVSKFPSYGKLSGRVVPGNPITIQQGKVINKDKTSKQHPSDFALWKLSKLGELSWESPWGNGRPGWHIECSTMINEVLGEHIDIHGGGIDLIFPHHENEIAQSEGIHNKPLANYWLYNGHVKIEGSKMSKSLHNFITIKSLRDSGINPMAIRVLVLQTHYRKPLEFTQESLISATNTWSVINDALVFGRHAPGLLEHIPPILNTSVINKFKEIMSDDFNTFLALSLVVPLAKEINKFSNLLVHENDKEQSDIPDIISKWFTINHICNVLGLNTGEIIENKISISEEEIEQLIQERLEARHNKDYQRGDEIREYLNEKGIKLIDTKNNNTTWIKEI